MIPKTLLRLGAIGALALTTVAFIGCGDDEDETEADRLGIAAECGADEDCTEAGQVCLMQFAGGYCGVANCQSHDDCPEASACVAHDDGNNYCFRTCTDKAECNENRSVDNEANCSANITFVGDDVGKACVPPSSGS